MRTRFMEMTPPPKAVDYGEKPFILSITKFTL